AAARRFDAALAQPPLAAAQHAQHGLLGGRAGHGSCARRGQRAPRRSAAAAGAAAFWALACLAPPNTALDTNTKLSSAPPNSTLRPGPKALTKLPARAVPSCVRASALLIAPS